MAPLRTIHTKQDAKEKLIARIELYKVMFSLEEDPIERYKSKDISHLTELKEMQRYNKKKLNEFR